MAGYCQRGEVKDDLVEYGDDPGRLVEKMDGIWDFQIIVGEPLGGKGPSWREGEMRGVEGESEGEVHRRGWVGRNQPEMHELLGSKVDLNIDEEMAYAVSGKPPVRAEPLRRVYALTGKWIEGMRGNRGEEQVERSGRETPRALSVLWKGRRGL